ncbi:MAG: anhydro-N-acetylmuramic acid kinase [Bacteroidales bacterium]|nr:anhydro-N-acetylmuramic acid kinase [Bacteroidales bacterium]
MIILGLMSGTSLDGVDMAVCDIAVGRYSILAAETVPYPAEWRQRLSTLETATALEYARAHVDLGHWFGRTVKAFLERHPLDVEAIASHGHTIFHQPAVGLTTQIGDGDTIAAETGLPVVSNFRTLDVALGGQGAPLVPIGDEMLFGQYDACLNLGGIANISYRSEGRRLAYDICPCNMALNELAARLGLDYDPCGENARRGNVDKTLGNLLDGLDYYRANPPKSLGKEWFIDSFLPLLEASHLPTLDLLATVTRHIAGQIAGVLNGRRCSTLLVTGGGAFNTYLIEQLAMLAPETTITVPDALIVNYKEALIFALLGYLRLTGQVNTLASVTGARCDSVGGTLSGLLPRHLQ